MPLNSHAISDLHLPALWRDHCCTLCMRLERPSHGEGTQHEGKTSRGIFNQVNTRVIVPNFRPHLGYGRQADLTRVLVATPTVFADGVLYLPKPLFLISGEVGIHYRFIDVRIFIRQSQTYVTNNRTAHNAIETAPPHVPRIQTR